MKSLMLLLHEVASENATWCHTSTTLDLKTIQDRVKHEGLSFLTITLPTFGKDLERALDQGYVDRSLFQGFSWKAGLPKLFSGFLDQVFDRNSGRLLDVPNIDAIRSVRQLTLMFQKVAIECSTERTDAAIDKYIECEKEVKYYDKIAEQEGLLLRLSEQANRLYREVFTSLDAAVYRGVGGNDIDLGHTQGEGHSYRGLRPLVDGVLLGRHGPGATADKLKGNRKFGNRTWTRRLESVFPYGRHGFYSWSAYFNALPTIELLEPGAEIPVKVITVPKTLKTPRIIAIEPSYMQYMQQAILEQLVGAIEGDDFLSPFIGFSDQVPNQEFARVGSLSGELATLDLSEASDRVSNQHVRALLSRFPHIAEAVDATRSRKADVPGYGVIRLAKFASMGSALCFPFEAMVFLTLIFIGIEDALNRPLTRKEIKTFHGKVRVYGDDIIVPVEYVSSVIRTLELFGLKVNASKSFWNGKFRESCGKEYYDGHDVSIVKVREMFPTSRKHARQIVSTSSLRNQLYKAGYRSCTQYIDEILAKLIPYPIVLDTSAAIGRVNEPGVYDTERMHPDLHKPLVKAMVIKATIPRSTVDGDDAMMKYFLKRDILPFVDREHLLRAGRPVSVDIKHRWTSAV